MIRSVDTERLQDICEDIAINNYGFIYLADHKDEIKEQYEQSDTGLKHKNSLSLSNLREGMQTIGEDDFNSFERLRSDAYFLNPFERPEGQRITEELESLFTQDIVLHKKRLESRFNIAPTDVDFFAQKLADEGYITKIPAGEREYFVGGPGLKDETSRDVGLAAQLKNKANAEGKISHRELEEIIDVAATSNVISYLSQNEYIIDLDGEYLVQEALDEFAASLAERIADPVLEEFEEADYVLHSSEFSQVVENKVNEATDILKQARPIKRELLELTEETLVDELGLDENTAYSMIILSDENLDTTGFEAFVDKQARSIKQRVANSDVTVAKKSDQKEAGRERIEELQVGRTENSREFIQREIRDRYDELVEEEWK